MVEPKTLDQVVIDKQKTIHSYNKHAKALEEHYRQSGVRSSYIDRLFSLVGVDQPKVFEIGCGDGRDARYILKLTPNYIGMDVAQNFVDIAKVKNPKGTFVVGDIEDPEFEIPQDTDVAISFASLHHSPKDELAKVFKRIAQHLKPNGVFHVFLKLSVHYQRAERIDQFGERQYYLYTHQDIIGLAGNDYEVVEQNTHQKNGSDWIEITFRKK